MDLRAIYSLMLRDKFGAEEIEKLAQEAEDQIRFSIRFLIEDLIKMGFSSSHAKLTASQIAPKPILYSLIIRNRILEDPVFMPDFPGTTAGIQQKYAYRKLQYQLLAPEFTAFLFDQIIDEYNSQNEETAVKKLIDFARGFLIYNPNLYLERIRTLFSLVLKNKIITDQILEDHNLQALRLLVPLIELHKKAKSSDQEISDLLYTVADVLTHEQIASNAFNKGAYVKTPFPRPVDYIDSILNIHVSDKDSALNTVARGILRNQGLLMVAVSQYMIIRSPLYFDRVSETFGLLRKPGSTTVRQILEQNSQMIRLVRFFELVVRAGDDIGDIDIDRKAQAPNCLLLEEPGVNKLLEASGISREISLQNDFRNLFDRAIKGTETKEKLFTELKNMKAKGMIHIGIKMDFTAVDDGHLFAKILNEVAYGAIFNAICNDVDAENMGNHLLNTPAYR
ncbi:MAG: hypothetical protein SF052_18880 [Bacteroidia bacterium]|nr:hypothetical protein [Bacteroidia bacterium]